MLLFIDSLFQQLNVLTNNMILCKIFLIMHVTNASFHQQPVYQMKVLMGNMFMKFFSDFVSNKCLSKLKLCPTSFSFKYEYGTLHILLWISTHSWKMTHITFQHSTIMYYLFWTIPFSSATKENRDAKKLL